LFFPTKAESLPCNLPPLHRGIKLLPQNDRSGATFPGDDKPAQTASLFARVKFWLEVIGLATPVGGVLWFVLMWFNPIGKNELTVRIERRVPISLPSDVRALPLRLQFEGKEIERAVLVELEIRNAGAVAIPSGDYEKRWKLELRSADGSAVVPAGPPTPSPVKLKADVVRGPSPDRIILELGVLDAKDTIRLAVILINPAGDDFRPVIADTQERIPGVRVVTTDQKVSERLRQGFALPIFAGAFALLLAAFGLEQFSKSRHNGQVAKLTVWRVLSAIVVVFFLAALTAWAVAGAIAWGVDLILYR
jgi:hypothetical protein